MALKTINPKTNAQRGTQLVDYRELSSVEPYKPLTIGLRKKGGRNNAGRITVRHRGGGAKRRYRIIDFKRSKQNMDATVETIEYDPNRTGFIARLLYKDGQRRYMLAPHKLQLGQIVHSSQQQVDIASGNTMPLAQIPLGSLVYNVEMKPGGGGKIARSAGTKCQLVARNQGYAQMKMPSGEIRKIPELCLATIGVVSNVDHGNRKLGKAGRKRHLGMRPTVRGVVMNPVDHPHGGGEGRTSGGRHPVSPWAKPTKGYKTRRNKRTDKFIIKRRK